MRLAFLSPQTPEERIGHAIAQNPACAWVFAFLHTFPEALLSFTGEDLYRAYTGKTIQTPHISIAHISPVKAQAWMHHTKPPKHFTVTFTEENTPPPIFPVDVLRYTLNTASLHDPLNALNDLREGRLHIPEKHIAHLIHNPERAFSALRLSAEHALTPSATTWRALLNAIPRVNHLTSGEDGHAMYKSPRVLLAQEGILSLKHGAYGWELFSQSGATPFAFPHLAHPQHHQEATQHFLGVHDNSVRTRYVNTPLSDTLLTASLFTHSDNRTELYRTHAHHMHHHRITHPTSTFSSEHTHQLLTKTHALLNESPQLWSLSRAEKILLGEQGDAALSLAHITTLHNTQHPTTSFANDVASTHTQHIAHAALLRERLVRDVQPPPLVKGRDLRVLGVAPGAHIRFFLNQIRDEQLKGAFASKEDALAYARTLAYKH